MEQSETEPTIIKSSRLNLLNNPFIRMSLPIIVVIILNLAVFYGVYTFLQKIMLVGKP
jgi:hypothetical protein